MPNPLHPPKSDDDDAPGKDIDRAEGQNMSALQEALLESEQRFEALLNLSGDQYWEQDAHFRFTRYSGGVDNRASAHAASHIGRTQWEVPAPEDDATDWSDHQAVLARHEPFRNLEHKQLDEDGKLIWLSTSGDPVFDTNNRFNGYRGTSRDITQQKFLGTALRPSEERLRMALANAGVGVWEWDMISEQVVWDKRQFELFGQPETGGTIPFSKTIDVIHPDDRDALAETAKKVLEEGATALNEFRVIHPDGSIHWLLGSSGVVQLDDNRTSAKLIGVNIDITKSKELEFVLRKSEGDLESANVTLEDRITKRTAELKTETEGHAKTQSELAASQRLDAIGQLTGGIAHDFNNLLTVVIGNNELLENRLKDDEFARSLLDDATSAAESGAKLVSQLLSFARQQPLAPQTIDLNAFVNGMSDMLNRTLGEDMNMVTKLSEDTLAAYADRTQLQNALLNIAINARDAMPRGGHLTIETSAVDFDANMALEHDNMAPGRYVCLSIRDTGTGIAPGILSLVVEPFFTTKDTGKGTGLGLSMVHGFAKQSRGHLEISSDPGHGTLVSLYLPDATALEDDTIDESQTASPPEKGGETILVVEDEARVRKTTINRLESLGYIVLDAESGQRALDILAETNDVDLVFTDMVMPGGMSGADVVVEVQKLYPHIKCIITSGYAEPSTRPNDGTLWLRKPYRLQELSEMFRQRLD